MNIKTKKINRFISAFLCMALLVTGFPFLGVATGAAGEASSVITIADPETLTRPELIYGDNTLNTGKITVGKSVSDESIVVNGQKIDIGGENNFLVTVSQTAQVMGLSSKGTTPMDVVFVIDTSGSMDDNNRAETLVTAANTAIKSLLGAHEANRVAVVAFSSDSYGGGTSNGNAANILSSLSHYEGSAASNHLTWVNSGGDADKDGNYIAGRDRVTIRNNNTNKTVNAYRHAKYGGTNIQAGIIEGANILANAKDTLWTNPSTGETVTRIPFLIVLSDGQPTFSYEDSNWYNPDDTDEQGPGSGAYEGNGFIAALTAAYYKGVITKHYFGESASDDKRCFVYTIGIEIEALDGANTVGTSQSLAQITLDPKTYTAGDYAKPTAKSYWNYGNTAFDKSQKSDYGWKYYWDQYQKGETFAVRVNGGNSNEYWIGDGPVGSGEPNRFDYRTNNEYLEAYNAWKAENYVTVNGKGYVFNKAYINSSKEYVNGVGYNGGIAYNDDYFSASDVDELADVFKTLVQTIQKKAITAPTKVTSGDNNFDGYVNFYDPLGEYTEFKDMKGLVANGYYYRGANFAKYLNAYGTADANENFDALIKKVIKTRMGLSAADKRFESEADLDRFIDELLQSAVASENQANYVNGNNFDNSFVWWGNAYNSGEEDEHIQLINFADNDSIEYIEEQKEAGKIPEGADYVCRSYFFYGEAGGDVTNLEKGYLYFVVRVQRELNAPYRQTVVISAPASLLSVEQVFIEESFDKTGKAEYTAKVEHSDPLRVVYEVGLWDSINEESVSYIVSDEYANEKVAGTGSVNYDSLTDTYHFFTNDWDRTQTLESHHRALTRATFDAASDNPFYTYQENTLIVDRNGNPVTSNPAGKTAYYSREYFEWTADNKVDGEYAATKKSMLVEIEINEQANLVYENGKWYIPKGIYTSATLVVNGDDVLKDDPATQMVGDGNFTGTSSIVSHPHRTGSTNNSHYTVFLGNNGKLSMKADPYVPTKTVSVNLSENATNIVDDNGKTVTVGDVLTYTVEVKNVLDEAANIVVTDQIPAGTTFVKGSAAVGTTPAGTEADRTIAPDENNVLVWNLNDVGAGEVRYVSFKVTVDKTALSQSVVPGAITNTAKVKLANFAVVDTNTTNNPPYGKTVTDTINNDINGMHGLKVGDTVVYHVRFSNNAKDSDGRYISANVKVSDKLPQGVTFVSADNGGTYDADTNTVSWTFENMAPEASKEVTFTVKIDASIKANAEGTQPAEGEIAINNVASIEIGNDPKIVLETNETENFADVGDMSIVKTVAEGGDRSKEFTLNLTESSGMLNGTYVLKRNGKAETVTFENGKAIVNIVHGDELVVCGLPTGAIITVTEDTSNAPGWTPTYKNSTVTITKGEVDSMTAVEIINTYELEPLYVTLKGSKKINGTLPAGATFGFVFVAAPDAENNMAGDPLTAEVTVKGEGMYSFEFSPETFRKPGTYKYLVYEVMGGIHGVTYDETEHTLIVTVTDNGDGTMSADAVLDSSDFSISEDGIYFENTYTPDDVPLTLTAQKILKVYDEEKGTYVDAKPAENQYRFQITNKETGNLVATGANDANGKILFNTFFFSAKMLAGIEANANGDKVKEFTFVVSEVIPELTKDPNMLYDLNGYEFKATLTLNKNGILSVTVNGEDDGVVDITGNATFTNYSNPDSVEITPTGNKTTSDAPDDAKFSFSVVNTENGNKAASGVGSANGSITFSALSYSGEGIYTYWIRESNAGNTTNGITYDNNRYLMKVTVERNEYNRLVARVEYYKSANVGSQNVADYTISANLPEFHNEYNAGGYINITAEKNLAGRDLKDREFAFKLVRSDNGGEIDGIVDRTGKITFSTLYYSEKDIPEGKNSAVIHYVMSEVIPEAAKLPGVTYDTAKYDVYVRITDNGNGTISAELVKPEADGSYTVLGTTDTGVVFNNVYAPIKGDEIKFSIKKTLTGRDLLAGEFEFLMFRGTNVTATSSPVNVATNDANGIVTFTHSIPATAAPGLYTYTICEGKGSEGGVGYDTSSYLVYVLITDDGLGNIVAAVVDASGAPIAEDKDGIVDLTGEIEFVNTYVPDDVSVKLEASKTLAGRPLRDKEFSFIVRENDVNGKIVATGSNDVDGNIKFSEFDISEADMNGTDEKTFTYVICESATNTPGITIDTAVYTVTVTVKDNSEGALTATINYPNNNPIVFNNVYTPRDTSATVTAFKTLVGKNLYENEFTFLLMDEKGNVVESVTNDASGAVRFKDIIISAADMVDENGAKVMEKTFVYTVSEKNESKEGMAYDEAVYTVEILVRDDANGNLTATVSYKNGADSIDTIEFTNSYVPLAIKAELEGTKTIVDTSGSVLRDEKYSLAGFEFVVYDTEGKFISDAISDENGHIVFTGFEFATAGEYRFYISEKTTDRAGYSTDNTVWCAHITVAYDAAKGELYESGEYIHLAKESHDSSLGSASASLKFINVYDPADVTLTLKALKVLDGRELKEHEFSFYIVDNSTGLRVAESRNHADGTIVFQIPYSKAGTYNYTVYETIPADANKLGGVTYTTESCDITVEVIDDGSGALRAEIGDIVAIGSGEADLTDTIVFYNSYKPANVDVNISAWKHMTGRELRAGEFSFELVNKADANDKLIASNTENGSVAFDTITYANAGVYEYVLREIKGELGGVTYDENEYAVTVTVTDNKQGSLVASVKYEKADGSVVVIPEFTNTYKPASVDYTPEATKIFEGAEMRIFDFELSGESFETQVKHNDEDGKVIFDTITFEKAGVYTFTVSEKAISEMEDVRWDTDVYTVSVYVSDNGNGNLVIDNVNVISENGRNDIVFRNAHEDIITEKEVFFGDDLTVSIDNKIVEVGDVLTYTLTYKNYSTKAENVTITDEIPEYTVYAEGSASEGGVFENGAISWTFGDVEPDEEITVSFSVIVEHANVTVVNKATVLEGENTFETNEVRNPVGEDEFVKNVFAENESTISIDGEIVSKGDVLVYDITYSNNDDFEAEVTITDILSQYLEYVEGSADNGGVYENGVLTWTVTVGAGESITVTFKAKVVESNVTVTNSATAVEDGNEIETNEVTNIVPEDKVEKDVFAENEPTISIDGEKVEKGDVLIYTVTYHNSYEAEAEVTITDILSSYLEYVEGSADNGGVYENGVLTWTVTVGAGESITVTFKAKVVESNVTVTNSATAVEDGNEIETNEVTNLVPEDKVEKDVFAENEPTISIDGEKVEKGDILVYTITYHNSYEAEAEVTITDILSSYLEYVEGSADNGGVYENGVLTWTVTVGAGESITVTFKAKVVADDVTVENTASVMEGENTITSNTVVNSVEKEPKKPPKPQPPKPESPKPESPKPQPPTPQTGDDMFTWVFFLILSSAAFVSVLMISRKRREEE